MVVYYRDEAVQITSTELTVGDRRYTLDRLEYVWHRRTRRFSRGGYVLVTRIGAVTLAVGLLAVALVTLFTTDFGPYTWYVLSAAAFIATVLAAAAGFGVDPLLELLDRSHERGHGVHEIWARVGGKNVLIFSTMDALRFGKVYRALQRAIEHSSHGSTR